MKEHRPVNVLARSARAVVVPALARLALQVHEVINAAARAARHQEHITGDAVYTSAAVELEAAGLTGRWVRVGCGRVIHVNSSDLLAGLREVQTPRGRFYDTRTLANPVQ